MGFSVPFYGCGVEGDFTFQIKIAVDFSALYDRAAIMLVRNDPRWLKAGIEYNGSVMTQGIRTG